MKLTALEKYITIIETLATASKGLTLSALSEITGQPLSSLHHALATFKDKDFVFQDIETKKYSLGLKFLALSRNILENLDIRRLARNELHKLHKKTDEMVFLSLFRNGRVVYIDKIQSTNKLVLATEIGDTILPHTCTSGRAILSGLSTEELLELFPSENLPLPESTHEPPRPERVLETRSELFYTLHTISQKKYAYAEELYYKGVHAVAAPIFLGKKVTAGVCVTGAMYTMSKERIESVIIPAVLESASCIEQIINAY